MKTLNKVKNDFSKPYLTSSEDQHFKLQKYPDFTSFTLVWESAEWAQNSAVQRVSGIPYGGGALHSKALINP